MYVNTIVNTLGAESKAMLVGGGYLFKKLAKSNGVPLIMGMYASGISNWS